MPLSKYASGLIAMAMVVLVANAANAQLSGLGLPGTGAAATERAQAQAQQRVQAQVQQRAQARVQQQVQAQTQARLQADASRAANIAQRTAAIAQRQAAAVRQRASGSANIRVGADLNSSNRVTAGQQSASVDLAARLGIESRLRVPADMTAEDVKIYDHFFGKFNPLRPQPTGNVSSENKTESTTNGAIEASSEQATSNSEVDRSKTDVREEFDLTSRIEVAARQRRAEISEMRDEALIASDAQLLLQAERMEEAMNAFVKAQSQVSSDAKTAARERSQTRTNADATAASSGNVDARSDKGVRSAAQTNEEAAANGESNLNR